MLVDSVTEKKPDANETVNSINQPDDVQMKKDEISDERSTVLKHEQDTQSNALSSICSYMSEDENDADTVKDQGEYPYML